MRPIVAASGQTATPAVSTRVGAALKTHVRSVVRGPGPLQILFRTRSMDAAAKWMADHGVPPPARGIRNTGEQAMLVMPEHACGVVIGFVGMA